MATKKRKGDDFITFDDSQLSELVLPPTKRRKDDRDAAEGEEEEWALGYVGVSLALSPYGPLMSLGSHICSSVAFVSRGGKCCENYYFFEYFFSS